MGKCKRGSWDCEDYEWSKICKRGDGYGATVRKREGEQCRNSESGQGWTNLVILGQIGPRTFPWVMTHGYAFDMKKNIFFEKVNLRK